MCSIFSSNKNDIYTDLINVRNYLYKRLLDGYNLLIKSSFYQRIIANKKLRKLLGINNFLNYLFIVYDSIKDRQIKR